MSLPMPLPMPLPLPLLVRGISFGARVPIASASAVSVCVAASPLTIAILARPTALVGLRPRLRLWRFESFCPKRRRSRARNVVQQCLDPPTRLTLTLAPAGGATVAVDVASNSTRVGMGVTGTAAAAGAVLIAVVVVVVAAVAVELAPSVPPFGVLAVVKHVEHIVTAVLAPVALVPSIVGINSTRHEWWRGDLRWREAEPRIDLLASKSCDCRPLSRASLRLGRDLRVGGWWVGWWAGESCDEAVHAVQ